MSDEVVDGLCSEQCQLSTEVATSGHLQCRQEGEEVLLHHTAQHDSDDDSTAKEERDGGQVRPELRALPSPTPLCEGLSDYSGVGHSEEVLRLSIANGQRLSCDHQHSHRAKEAQLSSSGVSPRPSAHTSTCRHIDGSLSALRLLRLFAVMSVWSLR